MRMLWALLAGVVVMTATSCATRESQDRLVRLNQVQVVGSHNSYRLAASAEESAYRRLVQGDVREDRLQYRHDPLDVQFSTQAIRQIELDVFVDRTGGRYADPRIRREVGHGPYDPAMLEPGLKVFHMQDIDYRTTCLTLVACLRTVESWSEADPSHLPIAILLELKDSPVFFGGFPTVTPEPFDVAALDALDAEIRSVFDEEQMITPDDVRGERETLEEAVLADGWPTLEASRGKVLFLMDNEGSRRTDYLAGHPSLRGRVLFTSSSPGQPDAAFVKRNDVFAAAAEIPELVAAGYVVRTRADVNTAEARADDTGRRDAALASGAQWVSTDYPVPDHALGFETDYSVTIPGGTVARCNPVNAPEGCVSALL